VIARELCIARNRLHKWAQDLDQKGDPALRGSDRPRARGIVSLIACLIATAVCAQSPRSDAFERVTPQQAGYSAQKLTELSEFLEKSGSDSLLLLHAGKVFFEWGDIHKRILVHSMRKACSIRCMGLPRSAVKSTRAVRWRNSTSMTLRRV
jgi:hypothetical protein